ncbi:MerR family transcriptional regulator [Paenibacillus agri]|uniref:MerR family transcriptional regulator n=1 Tax=Paenibacillus agri TaxID=2744309 RepID=A0A850EG49_9BACL|nr:MerR family transcriptional regulator [Paenibacillus agri]NUU59768.1 MerR family transcriptional regulator [Paenibacillus agri]
MYTIKQVVEMLGVPSVTLRAWENRYQAVTPERTESGYRLYTRDNVEDLRWLKEQTEQQGISISHAVRLLKARKNQHLDEGSASKGGTSQDAFEKMNHQIYSALYEFQGERANALIDYGFSLFGYEAMVHQVLVPVLVMVGDAWEKGNATVAQEHYITHMVTNRFYQFFHVFPVDEHLPKVLAFCPAGEHHQVGLLLFSLFLRKNGVEVIYLGANTPEEGVMTMLGQQSSIGAICLSVTNPELLPYTEELIRRLQQKCPEAAFIVGGKGYDASTTESVARYVINEPPDRWQNWFDDVFAKMLRNE